ncbi:MAG TPA: DUF456 domain-containing protein [Candidatus Moranbacteria bacterium]|jgi:hypothetical protein|nr:DUF456 domain-containing protein [Candidatus Moranbacteria bacterium]HOF42393.1 DUF456 domain-containing protein [Candidatus Moranbacteria bacterium]HPK54631.1 DUF456 domain-containing protein [Smithellaceae bacterium]HPX94250.1 DUF456 domain-containing protein [Candidatus Moranbacteria bacterium]HQB59661.1 DUF456 domain-containing protein [Candidatus Moranbacteria bacterium]
MNTLLIIALILIVLGVIGSIVPAMPGPILSFIGLVLLYFGKSGSISAFSLALFGGTVALLTFMVYIAPILGAKFSGASKKGLAGAILGGLAGIIFLPPLGIFIGAFLGALLGEMMDGKDFLKALKAGIGTILGSFSMIVLQVAFSLFVAIYFFIKLLS